MPKDKVFVGGDHAGYALKKQVLEHLSTAFPQMEFKDCGTDSEQSVDYPDYARKVADAVVKQSARGILICGSGIGVSIAANKVNGIRAALCSDSTSARLSREHNDANILCLGARLVGVEVALDVCRTWLTTAFQSGRHQRRVDLIRKLETGA